MLIRDSLVSVLASNLIGNGVTVVVGPQSGIRNPLL